MPRQLRLQYPGAIYHVMSRGDQQDDIFFDDVDRQDFLKTLASRLRRETTLTIRRIAARVHLGTSHNANVRLHEWMRTDSSKPPDALKRDDKRQK